jgi:Matrixin/Bacterial Ig-like domain
MSVFRRLPSGGNRNRGSKLRRRRGLAPVIEGLESRIVLYSASGNLWPNPQVIRISFMPDGTELGGGYTSNLNATFNSNPSLDGKWQNIILEAAQEWAQQTNINFTVVPDDGAPEGSGPDEQGYSGFGDIRIGGYNFGQSTLAMTYQPPTANNFSIAGDMMFNTGQSFNVGSTYDLFTVAMHEFGHALGLNESSVSNAVEYGTYTGVKSGLATDDINGIRAIYSGNAARSADAYNSNGSSNGTLSTAAPLNSQLSTSTMSALVPNLNISTAGQLEYFSFAAPAGTGNTLELDVQSSGLSLLEPEVTLYASNGSTVLASATGTGESGSTLLLSVTGVTAGEQFYVKVQGATTTQMGTGRYALGMSFNGATPPTEASPVIAEPDGNPQKCSDGQADNSFGYNIGGPAIVGITPDNGISSSDGISNDGSFSLYGTAPGGDVVTIYRDGFAVGQTVALANNTWIFNETSTQLSSGTYQFTAGAIDPGGYQTPPASQYQVQIDTHTPNAPSLSAISPETGTIGNVEYTNDNTPTFSGTTEPFAVVYLYANGSSTPFGATEADINGNWSFTVGQPGSVTYQYALTSSVLGSILGTTLDGLLDPVLGLLGLSTLTGPPTALPDGNYSITANVMDVAGTYSAQSSPMTLDVATLGSPSIAGVSLESSKVGLLSLLGLGQTQQSLSVVGTAPANDSVQLYLGGNLVGTAGVNSQGGWSYNYVPQSATVPSGIYAFSAVSADLVGDSSMPSPALQLQVGGGAASAAQYSSGTLSGSATAGSLVTIVDGDVVLGIVVASASGTWQFTPTLAAGKHSIMVETTNSAGYTSLLSSALSFTV